jgi:hypothetical protein
VEVKLPPGFYMYPGRSLGELFWSLNLTMRRLDQLKRQQHRSHQEQYERWPRSRIKSFRKEYRGRLRRYLPKPLVKPPLPTFERLPEDQYERAMLMVKALRKELL